VNGRASGRFHFPQAQLEGTSLFDNLRLRIFCLSESRSGNGISCGADGAFIGPIPLLKNIGPNCGVQEQWVVRPAAELNEKLTLLYDIPIDVAPKIGGMETVARALNNGKLALAKIATVQLGFPDPPTRPRTNESYDDKLGLAAELYWSALLKAGGWDPDDHPRAGTKPNPGHFAEKPKDPNLPARRGWPLPAVNEKVKEWIAEAAENIIPKAGRFLLDGLPIVDAISTFVSVLEPTDLNGGEDRLVAQMRTSFDPPKTLQELQQTPTENILGYEQHHIVEQTPDNIKKRPPTEELLLAEIRPRKDRRSEQYRLGAEAQA
jgi:hypothetical protein